MEINVTREFKANISPDEVNSFIIQNANKLCGKHLAMALVKSFIHSCDIHYNVYLSGDNTWRTITEYHGGTHSWEEDDLVREATENECKAWNSLKDYVHLLYDLDINEVSKYGLI